MASLAKRKRGNALSYEIQWFDDGDRKTISLGKKYSVQTATELKQIVEKLLYYRDNAITNPDKKTLVWLESAAPAILKKLGNAGLIEVQKKRTLGELWDSFLEQKTDVKESTLALYGYTKTKFFEFFDENELFQKITTEEMQKWKKHLLGTVAKASVARYIKDANACFNWAVEKEWIKKSPLKGVGGGSFVNKAKDRVITMEEYHRLLDACPCQDWRVIIALARIGGLRSPSETLALRWEDVNWERNVLYVHSPKTARHEGKESRLVPIFPELKTELETLFFLPESEGREFVINRYRKGRQTLGSAFAKIVKRAGLPTIPRPFDNMRASRSNEIYNRFGAFKESQWIGHSTQVAKDHYLMIQDSDYLEAAQWQGAVQTTRPSRPQQNSYDKLNPQLTGEF